MAANLSEPVQGAPSREDSPRVSNSLAGEHVVFLDRLSGMARRDARRLVREHGGAVADSIDANTTLAVIGDEGPEPNDLLRRGMDSDAGARDAIAGGRLRIVRESELWGRIGLVDDLANEVVGARRFYTPAMLADIVGVTTSTIRRWRRRGILRASRQVRRLPFFDFTEVTVALRLVRLLDAGCSLAMVERKLDDLARQMPDVERPLAEPSLVVEGKQLLIRRGEDLSEPDGQLLLDFDELDSTSDDLDRARTSATISIETARSRLHGTPEPNATAPTTEALFTVALEMDRDGDLQSAAEMYRAALVTGPSAETNFLLADVLYRMGDLSAARERYYAAIELDESFVEARANLGCVLAEMGQTDLAVAAFEGAISLQSDYPDVHFHLARTLDVLGRPDEAASHWRTFLNLSPDSPWSDEAEERLEEFSKTKR